MRHYKRKTERVNIQPELLLKAIKVVKNEKKSITKTAKLFGLNVTTLARYCNKIRNEDLDGSVTVPSIPVGYFKNKKVFTDEEEQSLEKCIKKAAETSSGLTPKEIRKLAYQFAIAIQTNFPNSWNDKQIAGEDWFAAFLKRHKTLKIKFKRVIHVVLAPDSNSVENSLEGYKRKITRRIVMAKDAAREENCPTVCQDVRVTREQKLIEFCATMAAEHSKATEKCEKQNEGVKIMTEQNLLEYCANIEAELVKTLEKERRLQVEEHAKSALEFSTQGTIALPLQMPMRRSIKTYKRKTERGKTPPDVLLKAIKVVKKDKKSITKTAIEFGINKQTLARYCRKVSVKDVEDDEALSSIHVGYSKCRQVFSDDQEKNLEMCIRRASVVFKDLTPKEIRKLAYYFAKSIKINVPRSWTDKQTAGEDWLVGYMKRRQNLFSVISAKPCSSFNEEKVAEKERLKDSVDVGEDSGEANIKQKSREQQLVEFANTAT